MSQENIEVVQAAIDAWNAGRMDTLRELYHPDVISFPASGMPEQAPAVGREAVMRGWEQLRETLDTDGVELISDFVQAGDRVVIRYVWGGTGHGPDLNLEMTSVYTVRGGKIAILEHFRDHTEALTAAGLSE